MKDFNVVGQLACAILVALAAVVILWIELGLFLAK